MEDGREETIPCVIDRDDRVEATRRRDMGG